jgi:hypothetical protein
MATELSFVSTLKGGGHLEKRDMFKFVVTQIITSSWHMLWQNMLYLHMLLQFNFKI